MMWEKSLVVHWSTKVIIVPISQTRKLIEKIIEVWQRENIINLSWIMNTTPKDIRNNKWVENFHFLFWPSSTKNLKMALAHNKPLSLVGQKIVKNSRKSGIQIIETSINEHDKAMTVIQWLHHLVRILIAHSGKSIPIQWIETNQQTIQDMVTLNPFMDWIMLEFKDRIQQEQRFDILKVFSEVVENNLSSQTIVNFWTPRFIEMLEFSRDSWSRLFLPFEETLEIIERF